MDCRVKKYLVTILVLLACSAPAAAEYPTSAKQAITIIDDFGDTVVIPGVPERIVSLAPSNTEIIFALGLGEKVVGVTEYCTYPPETGSIEKVGGFSTVNIEKVVSLHPDLVVAAEGNTEEVIDHLRDLGLTVITLYPQSIGDVLGNIELVGTATGKEAEAMAMTGGLQRRIDAVTRKTSSLAEKPTVAHIIWYDPLWVSGKFTFQEELIELAGGQNAFPGIEGWEIIGLEEFIMADPDIILVNKGNGMGAGGKDLIYENIVNDPRLQDLHAIREGRVSLVDSDMADRGGPRIVDALEMVAADIHPELFSGTGETPAPTSTPGFGVIAIIAVILGALLIYSRK
ncbi:MAG: cobalamin-binding protein [Methanomicrobiaceae archaeon]|nr:cobalamin-binding protein [Methanomicrobiaceae archaeon]